MAPRHILFSLYDSHRRSKRLRNKDTSQRGKSRETVRLKVANTMGRIVFLAANAVITIDSRVTKFVIFMFQRY